MIDLTAPQHHNALAWAGALGEESGKQPGTLGKPKLLDPPPHHPAHTRASAALAHVLQRARRPEYSKEMLRTQELLTGM